MWQRQQSKLRGKDKNLRGKQAEVLETARGGMEDTGRQAEGLELCREHGGWTEINIDKREERHMT